jgi:hypothetical protein
LLLVLLALGVISANMGGKLVVALQLEVVHHFIERDAGWPAGGFEPPATFGTTKTLKTLLFNPHQFPSHGYLRRGEKMQNLRSVLKALNRLTREKNIPVLTSSDEEYLYVWRADPPHNTGGNE